MGQCPIFVANELVIKADEECERLLQSFQGLLNAKGFALGRKSQDEEDEEDDHEVSWYWMRTFAIEKMGRKRRERAVSLSFDFYRAPSLTSSPWPYAREALLVVAYAGKGFKDPWTCSQLAVTGDDMPGAYAERWAFPHSQYQKIIVSAQSLTYKSWANRDWFFALPLRGITSPAVLDAQVVQPLTALLLMNDAAAVDWSAAVDWPASNEEDDSE